MGFSLDVSLGNRVRQARFRGPSFDELFGQFEVLDSLSLIPQPDFSVGDVVDLRAILQARRLDIACRGDGIWECQNLVRIFKGTFA